MRITLLKMDNEWDAVNVSRLCTGREGTQNYENAVKNLIKKQHWSPFEHVNVQFRIEAPIYVMRQWMRHSGAWMEKSRRYTCDDIQLEPLPWAGDDYEFLVNSNYSKALRENKPEEARKILPVGTYTDCIWTVNFRDFIHFLRLRLDEHAQDEIRECAKACAILFTLWNIETLKNFFEYDFCAQSFSKGAMDDFDVFQEEVVNGTETLRYRRAIAEEIMERAKDIPGDCRTIKLSPADSEELHEEVRN